MRSRTLVLISLVQIVMMLLIATPFSTQAQEGYVEQIVAENEALGNGCNAIGLAVENAGAPVAPTQEWFDEHMACVGTVRAAAQCFGATGGDRRFELCALIVVDGDGSTALGCEDFTMETAIGPFGADPAKTNENLEVLDELFRSRNLVAYADALESCADSPVLSDGAVMVAFFDMDRTDSEVGFRVKVAEGLGSQAAFIVTEARMDLPS